MNIIEAVGYLTKVNNNAVFSNVENSFHFLKRENEMIRLCNEHGDPISFTYMDFNSSWVLEETDKPQRTHQEIMTNWFRNQYQDWQKVTMYIPNQYNNEFYEWVGKCRSKEFFNDLEMAEMPPEN